MSKSSAMGLAALLGAKDPLGFALLGDISRMNDVKVFEDPTVGVWNSLPNSPVSMQGAICIADGTKIYLFPGGSNNSVWIYDTILGTWSSGLADGINRTRPSGTKIGREIFIFESQARIYNMDTNTWRGGANPTYTAQNSTAVSLNGKIYILYTASTPESYYLYDPVANTYVRKSGFNFRPYMTSAVINDKIYVFGGNVNEIVSIDPITVTYKQLYIGIAAQYGYAAAYKDISLVTGTNAQPSGTMNALFDSNSNSVYRLPDRIGGSHSPCCAFVDDVCYVFDLNLAYKIKLGIFTAPFDGVAFSTARATFPITKGLTYVMGGSPALAVSA